MAMFYQGVLSTYSSRGEMSVTAVCGDNIKFCVWVLVELLPCDTTLSVRCSENAFIRGMPQRKRKAKLRTDSEGAGTASKNGA